MSTAPVTDAPASMGTPRGTTPAKTILFVMSHRGFIRNYDPSLRLLCERGHRIHIVYTEPRARKGEILFAEWLTESCPGISVDPAPAPETGTWRRAARLTRLLMDCVRYFDRHFSQATVLRQRAHDNLAPWLRAALAVLGLLGDRGVRATMAVLGRVEAAIPISRPAATLVDELQPDLVLVTPLVEFASELVDYVKAAKTRGIPTGCCVASWDNLTNKGHLCTSPDRVFVWNEPMKEEAISLHGIPPENVVVTGAQLFDHWFEWRPQHNHEEFCHRVGLDPRYPFIVFLGSSQWIAPAEPFFVERWIRHIRSVDNPAVANLGILVRPHPTARWRYLSMDLSQVENAAIWPPYTTADRVDYFTDEGKNDFFETLYHTSAAVGVNTSAMIEAGILDCPTCTIHVSEFSHAQDGTLHFDLLRETAGGLVRQAETLEEHISHLAEAVANGRDGSSRPFVESFVRPHGLGRPAAPILADAIEKAAELSPAARPTAPLGQRALRLLLYPGALLLRIVDPFAAPKKSSDYPIARKLARVWIAATFGATARGFTGHSVATESWLGAAWAGRGVARPSAWLGAAWAGRGVARPSAWFSVPHGAGWLVAGRAFGRLWAGLLFGMWVLSARAIHPVRRATRR